VTKLAGIVVCAGLLAVIVLALPARSGSPACDAYCRMAVKGQVARFKDAARTIRRHRRELGSVRQSLRRVQRPIQRDSRYAIHLAAIAYRQSESDMLRVANCESPGLIPTLVNRTPHRGEHATGLFQFLPSTWRSTPYGHLNIFDPVVNALATGWMWTNGRRGEWACQ
jgi:hypothetical protein